MTGLPSIGRRRPLPPNSGSILPGHAPLPAVSSPPLPLTAGGKAQAASGPALPPRRGFLGRKVGDVTGERKRLLIGFDATASRAATWAQAARLTKTLIDTLPGQLEVALAAHGGSRLHTVTQYTTDAAWLRTRAARISCEAGYTRMVDMLADTAALKADMIVYIGDSFEELASEAQKAVDQLAKGGTRVIILQEGFDSYAGGVFAEIADRTGGAVLPFDISSFDRIGKELLELVAILAVQGVEAVEAKRQTVPAAKLLLANLDRKRLMIGHKK